MDLSSEERNYLLELLRAAHTELLHELHHTDTRAFEELLRQRVALNESVTGKIESAPSTIVH